MHFLTDANGQIIPVLPAQNSVASFLDDVNTAEEVELEATTTFVTIIAIGGGLLFRWGAEVSGTTFDGYVHSGERVDIAVRAGKFPYISVMGDGASAGCRVLQYA